MSDSFEEVLAALGIKGKNKLDASFG